MYSDLNCFIFLVKEKWTVNSWADKFQISSDFKSSHGISLDDEFYFLVSSFICLALSLLTIKWVSLKYTPFCFSIQRLPLSQAVVISFTTPIMATIMARVILHEKLRISDIGGICCFLYSFQFYSCNVSSSLCVWVSISIWLLVVVGRVLWGSAVKCFTLRSTFSTNQEFFLLFFCFWRSINQGLWALPCVVHKSLYCFSRK